MKLSFLTSMCLMPLLGACIVAREVECTPIEIPWRSGDRLRAVVVGGDDECSTPHRIVWHDTVRNHDCDVRSAEDGVGRCLPPYGVETENVVLYYTGAGCTGTELAGGFGTHDFSIGIRNVALGQQLIELGDAASGPILSRRLYNGTCVASEDPDWLSEATIVQPSALVGGAFEDQDVGLGTIRQSLWRGEDGSVEPRELIDTATGVPFGLRSGLGASATCKCASRGFIAYGSGVAPVNRFADPGCIEPAGCLLESPEPPPYVVGPVLGAARPFCPAPEDSATFNADAVSTTAYYGEPGACFEEDQGGTPAQCATLGDRVEIPFTIEHVGEGRLRPLWAVVGGQLVSQVGQRFQDIDLDFSCRSRVLGDVARCLPPERSVLGAYSDAQCTSRVALDVGSVQFDYDYYDPAEWFGPVDPECEPEFITATVDDDLGVFRLTSLADDDLFVLDDAAAVPCAKSNRRGQIYGFTRISDDQLASMVDRIE